MHNDEGWMRYRECRVVWWMVNVVCNAMALTLGPCSYPSIIFFFYFCQLLNSNMQQLRVGIFCFRHHKQDATFPGSTQLIIIIIMSPFFAFFLQPPPVSTKTSTHTHSSSSSLNNVKYPSKCICNQMFRF